MSELETRQLFGRRQIYTDVEVITADNVVEVLRDALSDHTLPNDTNKKLTQRLKQVGYLTSADPTFKSKFNFKEHKLEKVPAIRCIVKAPTKSCDS